VNYLVCRLKTICNKIVYENIVAMLAIELAGELVDIIIIFYT